MSPSGRDHADQPPRAGRPAVLSVWPVARLSPAQQRAGRYLADSQWHPDRTLPTLAARLITTYSRAGELVVDPMAGTGTTLVEAAHLGRRFLGMDIVPRWASLAAANVDHAHSQGATGYGITEAGDGRYLHQHTPSRWRRAIALITFTPPQLPCGLDRIPTGTGQLQPWADLDHTDHTRAAMTHRSGATDTDTLAAILDRCRQVLRPGGILAITARGWRYQHAVVDLTGDIIATALQAGLVMLDHHIALHLAIHGGHLAAHDTRIAAHQRASHDGVVTYAPAFDDVLVFQEPRRTP